MQVTKFEKMIQIIADEGMRITTADRDIFVEKLYLPPDGDVSIYEEVGRDVWKYFIDDPNPDVVELQRQTKDINDTLDVIMTAVASSDELSYSTMDVILLAIDDIYVMLESLMMAKVE